MANFLRGLARGADRGAQNYVAGRERQRSRQDRLDQQEEAQRRYEATVARQGVMDERYDAEQVRQRLSLGVTTAMESGDPDAIAASIQAAVEGKALPSTSRIMPSMRPVDAGTGEVDPRMVIDGSGTTTTAESPYAGMDPLARGMAGKAGREKAEQDRQKFEWEKLQREGYSVLGDNVLFKNTFDEEGNIVPQYHVDGRIDYPTRFDPKTGIVNWKYSGPKLANPEIMEHIDQLKQDEYDKKLGLVEAKEQLKIAGITRKTSARINEADQKALGKAFKTVNAMLTHATNPITLKKALSDLDTMLFNNAHKREFIETASIGLAENYNKFKIGLSPSQKQDLVGIRTSQLRADELLTQLQDEEVRAILGPVAGNWSAAMASLTGSNVYSEKQKAFLTTLMRLRDTVQRDATGAAISMKELDFYKQLVGDQAMGAGGIEATLQTLISDMNTNVKAYYMEGLLQKNEKLTPELIRELEETLLFNPTYEQSEESFDMGLDDNALNLEEPSTPKIIPRSLIGNNLFKGASQDSVVDRILPKRKAKEIQIN
mgnify:FL=1